MDEAVSGEWLPGQADGFPMILQALLALVVLVLGFFFLLFASHCSDSGVPPPEYAEKDPSLDWRNHPPDPSTTMRSARSPGQLSREEKELAMEINAARHNQGLPSVEIDAGLVSVAREWASILAPTGQLVHRTPDDLGTQRARNELRLINENLYFSSGNFDAQAIVTGWMNSPGHRANLLDPNITLQGVGLANTPSGGYVAVFNGGR